MPGFSESITSTLLNGALELRCPPAQQRQSMIHRRKSDKDGNTVPANNAKLPIEHAANEARCESETELHSIVTESNTCTVVRYKNWELECVYIATDVVVAAQTAGKERFLPCGCR